MPAMSKASTSPFKGQVRKPKQAPKHDMLCITVSGLRWCWCKCAQCWDPLGCRCICAHCHCYSAARAA